PPADPFDDGLRDPRRQRVDQRHVIEPYDRGRAVEPLWQREHNPATYRDLAHGPPDFAPTRRRREVQLRITSPSMPAADAWPKALRERRKQSPHSPSAQRR